jgi:hypothetical protein
LCPSGVMDAGDGRVVLLLQQEGRIIGSGDRVESPLGYLVEIRDTLVTRVEIFFSWEATLEAAGLSA